MTDFDDVDQLARFIESIGVRVGPGQTIPRPNDEAVEWRGTSHGHDVRIHVDVMKEVEVSAKLANPHGTVLVMWDREMVPDPNGGAPPWDDRDIVRVFVGRGTFLYAKPGVIDEQVGVFHRLPRPLTDALIDAMQKVDIRYVKLHESGIDAAFRELLPELPDAPARISTFTQFVGWAAAYLAGTPAEPAPAGSASSAAAGAARAEKMTCAYCKCLFLFGPSHRCPSCGAPVAG
ncbi:MAG: hypothetical protein IPM35_36150 [Myxococcales bacterium]|nr:hypothetical protein [Myxococcales bacterium]